ncbi:MAG: adenylate/guanylate cyclase domain-containing protein [bacterium]
MKNIFRKKTKGDKTQASLPVFIGIGFLVFAITFSLYKYGFFYGVENFFEDILFSTRPVDSQIVILEIDNQSIEKIGQWPWKREVFARAFSELNKFKPKAVGLDVIMSEPSRFGSTDDKTLADAFSKISYPIVAPVEALILSINREGASFSDGFLKPIPEFNGQKNISFGHVNLISDKDGIVRSLPFEIRDVDGFLYKGLAYETLERGGISIPQNIENKPVERIVFSGPNGSVRRIPFWRIFESSVPSDLFRDRVIFIGATAADLHDEKPTPFDKGTQMSGVEIQAQIANMFEHNYRLRDLGGVYLFAWILLASILPCLIFYFAETVQIALVFNLILGVIYAVSIIVLFDFGIVVSIVYVNISWITATSTSFFYRFLGTDKEKREMRKVFSKYVSKDVLNEILSDPSKVKLGGEEREVTVFFSDVRSFTTLSEGMSPSKLTNFLNKYLTRMTNIILNKKGVVDKYIGDAIMAFWGAPVDNQNQALDGILSSLDMVDSLADFNENNKKEGDPEIDIGIGLNTGKVTVGNMGSEARFDYTVMGDTVNLASRLEGQTKTYGVKIIISEATKDKLGQENIDKYNLLVREIDKIKVKGKNLPVTIFEVVARKKVTQVNSILEGFNKLRKLYYEGKWEEGVVVAKSILSKVEDGPTKVLSERCVYFLEHQPENWIGVYEMKSK